MGVFIRMSALNNPPVDIVGLHAIGLTTGSKSSIHSCSRSSQRSWNAVGVGCADRGVAVDSSTVRGTSVGGGFGTMVGNGARVGSGTTGGGTVGRGVGFSTCTVIGVGVGGGVGILSVNSFGNRYGVAVGLGVGLGVAVAVAVAVGTGVAVGVAVGSDVGAGAAHAANEMVRNTAIRTALRRGMVMASLPAQASSCSSQGRCLQA